jgi:signal transduction histidine kinase
MDEIALAVPSLPEDFFSPLLPLPIRPVVPSLRPEAPPASAGKGRDLALAGIAHDARNLVTALRLCADLIAEPGVLSPGQQHFAEQVRGLAEASDYIFRRLSSVARTATLASQVVVGEVLIEDLALAVRQLASLLSAVAGPAVTIEIVDLPCPGALALSEESLTRILLNLIRNAVDAMPVGRIRIITQRGPVRALPAPISTAPASDGQNAAAATGDAVPTVLLTVEDEGPGIPESCIDRIFDPGFSTRRGERPWPGTQHHGLGLSIVRELTEAAGGRVQPKYRSGRGACFELEFPLTNVTSTLPSESTATAGSGGE